jgi:hypothetical protein
LANEYYAVSPNLAVYIAWTEDREGHLQGQVEIVGIESANSTQLKTTNASFTGSRSGSDVSLTFGLLTSFGGSTWTGHLGWNALTLVIPTNGVPQQVTLSAGSFGDFQRAVSRFEGSVSTNQTKASLYNAALEARNHTVNGEKSMNDGLAQLRTLFAKRPGGGLRVKYALEWQKMQESWEKVQAAAQVAPMTCYQFSEVQYLESNVQYELSEFQYLDSEAQYGKWQYDAARRSVTNGIGEIEVWAPLFDARNRAYSNYIGQTYSRSAVKLLAPEVSSATKSLSYFGAQWSAFASYVNDYDNRVKQLFNNSQSFVKSLACNG